MQPELGINVLFINDDADEGKMMQIFLREKRQDRVIICHPTDQRLSDIIEQEDPELILISFIDGLDAVQIYQELRANPKLQETPIMFWRVTKNPVEFYPIACQLGLAGWIDFICRLDEFLEARDVVLAGGTYYPSY